MKNKIHKTCMPVILFLLFLLIITACGNGNAEADAYGNFEADEIIVSAQVQGILVRFNITEGNKISHGDLAGMIDSSVPAIKRDQLSAQYSVIAARLNNLNDQIKVQEEQRNNMAREVQRTEKLLHDKAATQQQFDDLSGKLKVIDKQTGTIQSQRNIILGERSVLNAQLEETANQLEKCKIVSPITGTVLEKYVNEGELVVPGKALFKLADVSYLELKAYISGSQLSSVSAGDTVTVMIDSMNKQLQKLKGVITWISSQAEFTPKIIQTRQERVNLVYGMKIRVKNDGRLKIGMPGEVVFSNKNADRNAKR